MGMDTLKKNLMIWFFAALAVFTVLYFFGIDKTPQSFTSEKVQSETTPGNQEQRHPKISIDKAFPYLNSVTSAYADPVEDGIIWFLSDGIAKYDIKSNIFLKIFAAEDGINQYTSSILRNKKYSFVVEHYAGGIKRMNLNDKTSKLYSVKDGLVNGSNLHMEFDPTDNNIIWIGTFNGLSKFNIAEEKFTNFTNEIGIRGTAWEVNEGVVPDKDFVWVRILANAYSAGGIARYNKSSGEWIAWGPEAFGRTDRIDLYNLEAYDGRVFASTFSNPSVIYTYNQAINKWESVYAAEKGLHDFTYLAGKLFFIEDTGVKYIDLSDYSAYNIASGYNLLAPDDIKQKIYMLHWPDNIAVYDIASQRIQKIDLPGRPEFKISGIAAAKNATVLFNAGAGKFLLYDMLTNKLQEFKNLKAERYGALVAKIFSDNTAVLIYLPGCEFTCYPGGIYHVSLADMQIMHFYPLSEKILENGEIYYANIAIGDNISEIYFLTPKIARADAKQFKFNSGSGQIEESNISYEEVAAKFSIDGIEVKDFGRILNPSGSISAMVEGGHVRGDSINVKIKWLGSGKDENFTINFEDSPYNPFGWFNSIDVKDAVFDSKNADILWIGTNRGLVRLDFSKKTFELFTTESGLAENEISKIFVVEKLTIQHPGGIYIYDLK